MAQNELQAALRLLPSVEVLLRDPGVAESTRGFGHDLVARLVRGTLDAWRTRVRRGGWDADRVEGALAEGLLLRDIEEAARGERGRGVRSVVNATGIVLHTGLGRAPVHPEVAERMAEAARSYCVLEVDRFSGLRNQRDDRLGELLVRATGAERGIAVNNCAAAVLLVLNTFGTQGETILSRGELVEIGGSFRMPDVMERAGTQLREVGTTNRTRIGDYRSAVGPTTGLLLKVHTSNYRVRGFTEDVSPTELAELGRETSLPSAYDLGSGLLEPEGVRPLDFLGESSVRDAVKSGVDCVMFSGDKLLGGPQAGLIVGKGDTIETLRKNPMYRALRLDKVSLAGLEATLERMLDGRAESIPSRALMLLPPEEVLHRARALAAELDALGGFQAEVRADASQPGSGSAPDVFLDTHVVVVRHAELSSDALASALRAGDPPVFARIHEDRLLLDPRTLLEGDAGRLVEACSAIAGAPE